MGREPTRAEQHYETYLDDLLTRRVDAVCDQLEIDLAESGGLKEYQKVSPQAREKLKGILKHYSRQPQPFRTCVRDQVKHGLSLDMAQRRCAVIKDLIRNTTYWRGEHKGAPKIGGGMMHFVDDLNEMDLWDIVGEIASKS